MFSGRVQSGFTATSQSRCLPRGRLPPATSLRHPQGCLTSWGEQGRTPCGVPGEGRTFVPASCSAPSSCCGHLRAAALCTTPCTLPVPSHTQQAAAGYTQRWLRRPRRWCLGSTAPQRVWSSCGRHEAWGQERELGTRTQRAHVSLPTCSPPPSRTPPWRRTCRPPGAGSPARSPCLSPSSPPPSAPAPGRAARLPGDGDKDAKCRFKPSRSSTAAPSEESSPLPYLLLHVVCLPGLLLHLQSLLQRLHFCLQRDQRTARLRCCLQGAQQCQQAAPRSPQWCRGGRAATDLMPPLPLLLLLRVLLLERGGDGRAARLQLPPQLLRLRSLPAHGHSAARSAPREPQRGRPAEGDQPRGFQAWG